MYSVTIKNKMLGCLIGGAIGDALGYPIECLTIQEIKKQYGLVTDFVTKEKEISDDTQMTLFSLEGLILTKGYSMGHVLKCLYESYRRWFDTQYGPEAIEPEIAQAGMLHQDQRLFAMRAPGHACIDSLRKNIMGTCDTPINLSKGNGCIMRAAPFGFLVEQPSEYIYQLGKNSAAITHGDTEAQECTGAFSLLIYYLLKGLSPLSAVNKVNDWLKAEKQKYAENVFCKMLAINTADSNLEEKIKTIGDGWIAPEALTIAVLYLLNNYNNNVRKCFTEIINCDGDSDTISAIFGNLYGAAYGIDAFNGIDYNNIECIDLIPKLLNTFLELRP